MINIIHKQKLIGAYGLFYFADNSIVKSNVYKNDLEDILEILFIFENNTLLIKCDSSATNVVCLLDTTLEDVDMEEYGCLKSAIISQIPTISNYIGKIIYCSSPLKYENEIVGLTLNFNDNYIDIFNWDDELKVTNNRQSGFYN